MGFLDTIPEDGVTRVFILSHERDIPLDSLLGMFPWIESDKARIMGFAHGPSRTSFCVSRSFVRTILSRMTGTEWDGLPWLENRFGKPGLADSSMRFNLSHAEGCLVFAVCVNNEIGCDVEVVDREISMFRDIAESHYTPEEISWVGNPDDAVARERFISLFVQKEAWLKALGFGLNAALSSAPATLRLPDWQAPDALHVEKTLDTRYFVSVRTIPPEGKSKKPNPFFLKPSRTRWEVRDIRFSPLRDISLVEEVVFFS